MRIEHGPGVNRRDSQAPWLICDELTGEEVAMCWTTPDVSAIVLADPARQAVRVGDPAMLAEYRRACDTRPFRVVAS